MRRAQQLLEPRLQSYTVLRAFSGSGGFTAQPTSCHCLKSILSTLQTRHSTLQTRLSTLQARLSPLQTRLSTLITERSTPHARLSTLMTRCSTLRTGLQPNDKTFNPKTWLESLVFRLESLVILQETHAILGHIRSFHSAKK